MLGDDTIESLNLLEQLPETQNDLVGVRKDDECVQPATHLRRVGAIQIKQGETLGDFVRVGSTPSL